MDRDTQPDNDRQQELFPWGQTADEAADVRPSTQQAAGGQEGQMSFEQALQRLEQTVARLESPDITLDESLRLFQEGTRLSRICSELLETIEHRITQLVDNPDGTLQEIPFRGDAE